MTKTVKNKSRKGSKHTRLTLPKARKEIETLREHIVVLGAEITNSTTLHERELQDVKALAKSQIEKAVAEKQDAEYKLSILEAKDKEAVTPQMMLRLMVILGGVLLGFFLIHSIIR